MTRAYTSNGLNQYTASGSATLSYDSNGNLSSDGSTSYVYDDENHLVSASGTHSATLAYDPLGRLWQSVGSVTGTTDFEYDGDRILEEWNGSGTLQRLYVYGAGEAPIAWYEFTGGTTRRYLLPDERGSTVAVADDSGNAVAINRYDEYGIPQSGNGGRFQYASQALLIDLGLFYDKARVYSPTLGRFLQTDPIGYGDGMNWYGYVKSDPVNRVDPTGLFEGDSEELDAMLAGVKPKKPKIVCVDIAQTRMKICGAISDANGDGKIDARDLQMSSTDPAHEYDCKALGDARYLLDFVSLTSAFNAPNWKKVVKRLAGRVAGDAVPGVGEGIAAVQFVGTILDGAVILGQYAAGCH